VAPDGGRRLKYDRGVRTTRVGGTGERVDRHLRRDLVLLFVGQLVVLIAFRLALPADLAANESTDFTLFYGPVAEHLADGDGLEVVAGVPALRYPPGYPIVLAATFRVGDALGVPRSDVLVPFTLALTAVAGVLLHLVVRRVFDRRHAWVTSVLWIAYPLTLWTAKQPNSEIPFMVAMYAAVLVFLPVVIDGTSTPGRLLGAGGLLGAAAVIRPAGLVLLPAVALVAWLRLGSPTPRRLLLCLALVGGFLAPVTVASAWMSSVGSTPVLLSDSPDLNVIDGLSLAVGSRREAEDLPMPENLRRFVIDARGRETELGREGTLGPYLREAIREHPAALVELVAYKSVRSWYGTESFRFEGVLLAMQLLFVGIVTAGGVVAFRRGDPSRWYVVLAASMTMASWISAIAALSIVRYLVPALGLLMPLAAVAVVAATDHARAGTRR